MTGNGVNDDHNGRTWSGMPNNWVTSVWADSTQESDLLGALTAGRAWCGSLSYRGSLDMLMVDGACPMGSVSVSDLPSRQLQVIASQLPLGGKVEVVQGAVDYAGTADLVPSSRVIAVYSETDLADGSALLSIDTSVSSFVRTQVRESGGTVVGLSNPIWLLREEPVQGIPPQRAC